MMGLIKSFKPKCKKKKEKIKPREIAVRPIPGLHMQWIRLLIIFTPDNYKFILNRTE